MSIINPRRRLINFRLTSDEYESVLFACQAEGVRTVSEYARATVLSRARQEALEPQSIVKWLMLVAEDLSALSRQTAEVVRWIRAQNVSVPASLQDTPGIVALAEKLEDPAMSSMSNQPLAK